MNTVKSALIVLFALILAGCGAAENTDVNDRSFVAGTDECYTDSISGIPEKATVENSATDYIEGIGETVQVFDGDSLIGIIMDSGVLAPWDCRITAIKDVWSGEIRYYAVTDRMPQYCDEGLPDKKDMWKTALYSVEGNRLTDYDYWFFYAEACGMVFARPVYGGQEYGLYDIDTLTCVIPDLCGYTVVSGLLLLKDTDQRITRVLDEGSRSTRPFEIEITPKGGWYSDFSENKEYILISDRKDPENIYRQYVLDKNLTVLAQFDEDVEIDLPGNGTIASEDILTVKKNDTFTFYSMPEMKLIRSFYRVKDGIPEYIDEKCMVMIDNEYYLQNISGRNLAGPMNYILSSEGRSHPIRKARYFYGFDAAACKVCSFDRDGNVIARIEDPQIIDIAPCGDYLGVTMRYEGSRPCRMLLDHELREVFPGIDFDDVALLFDHTTGEYIPDLFIGTNYAANDLITCALIGADGAVLADGLKSLTVMGDGLLAVSDSGFGIMDHAGKWVTCYAY